MAEIFGPFEVDPGDPGDVDEDIWTKMARLFAVSGVIGVPGSAALQIFADSSGMQVFGRVGRAFPRGEYYENNTTKTISIPSNAGPGVRVDHIVLEVDPSADTIEMKRITTALSSTDTGLYHLWLADVNVPAGAVTITAGNVVDKRLFSNSDIIPCRLVADITAPTFGLFAPEASTGQPKWYTGSAWDRLMTGADIQGAWANLPLQTGIIKLSTGGTPQYRREGDRIKGRGIVAKTDGTVFTGLDATNAGGVANEDGSLLGTLPGGFLPAEIRSFPGSGELGGYVRITVLPNGHVRAQSRDTSYQPHWISLESIDFAL